MKMIFLVLGLFASSSVFGLVGVYDYRFVGYVRGDAFVGINHKGEAVKLNVDLDNFSKEQIADLYDCEFRALGGENFGFTVDVGDEGQVQDAGCYVAPVKDFRKAWQLMVGVLGL